MIKLTKTIVDRGRTLVGFVAEGKGTDFNEVTNDRVQRPLQLNSLMQMKFSNNQVMISDKGIQERGNFKVNELPMAVYVDNKFIDVDNKISIVKKYVQNNEIIGFTVKFGDGTMANFTYANIIKLSFWFKPSNFVVRTSANNKKFIASKPGYTKLEDLITEVIGEDKKQKKNKSAAKDSSQTQSTGTFDNTLDLFDLYDSVNKSNGLIIKLPSESYHSTGEVIVQTSGEFKSLGVGEYAYPILTFNETKLNANTTFKKPGMVSVEFGPGVTMPIQSYTSKTKNIFFNSENHIDRIGVAIPKTAEAEFIGTFSKSMGIKQIKNDTLIKSISSLSGRDNLVFYAINTHRIDLIAKEKLDGYILPTKKLRDAVDELFIYKAITKYLAPGTGMIGDLKKRVAIPHQEVAGNQPLGLYAGMSQEFREKIVESGIDIYTGAFIKTIKPEKSDILETEKEKKQEDSSVVIEYCIAGKEYKKWTYKKIREYGLAGIELPNEVIALVKHIEIIPDDTMKMQEAYRFYVEYCKKRDKLTELIWKHKCAMYLKSGRSNIHQHDKDKWESNTKKKTKAQFYNCTEVGCTDLMVAVLNTEI